MRYDLGYIDLEQRTFQTIDNPFGTRVSPMSQVQSATYASGLCKGEMAEERALESNILHFKSFYPVAKYIGVNAWLAHRLDSSSV